MSDACVIAVGAVSALGVGPSAYHAGDVGAPARVVLTRDEELARAGLARPFAARAPGSLPLPAGTSFEDQAATLLACALGQIVPSLDEMRPGWRDERLGIAVGTSSGGMLGATRWFAAREAWARGEEVREDERAALARRATYFAPFDEAFAAADLSGPNVCRRVHLVAACAASTLAIGLGLRWLDRGACDLVIAGGYDAVSGFVATGFEALRATTASRPRPFRIGRDGMSLGEGAGLVALVREEHTRGASVFVRVAGFGASTDAVHITAPDRTGDGLARAGAAAIADSGLAPASMGLVSAHATATPFNDAMESRAIARLFENSPAPVVHPFKAQIGHTLGAAGVLESLAAADALRRGIAPAAAGEGELDPDAAVSLLDRAEARPLDAALKLSAAFGGANAALVLTRAPSGRVPRQARPVYLHAHAAITSVDLVELSALTGVARDRLARLDPLCRLGMRAVAELARVVGREALAGAGIVAGHALATLDTNDRFDARRRARGPGAVDPRLFPATSPNAVAGECAIVYQLRGPSFAVNAGLDGGTEALSVGAELVAMGDADRVVVLAVDDAGPVARDLLSCTSASDRAYAEGAVAVLLGVSAENALALIDPDITSDHDAGPLGHLALQANVLDFVTKWRSACRR
ncbi:beta-ketoacyl synthase N-terminal-like domain-containing protein [Polyangium mundeleinium]|uniref:Beta-ketoacyl synthase N-terminal-like domain-containing protein n=1 Tax=Polyangium mundeleinium TaxID=2995306 RepID=A0ABT5F0I9_9BACT|nr:beta-ketoacyl synthase N-terminal-like domain-containing protein [Polyangium mundeleinium]MDC0746590.1 beta-ketoacyl synthase N-terminal-like domain-containing protein [Polyangium mundeleinium]